MRVPVTLLALLLPASSRAVGDIYSTFHCAPSHQRSGAHGGEKRRSAKVLGPGGIDTGLRPALGGVSRLSDPARGALRAARAAAEFTALEQKYRVFRDFHFNEPQAFGPALACALKAKASLSSSYLEVLEIRDPDWAIAALVRIGFLPVILNDRMREAEQRALPEQARLYASPDTPRDITTCNSSLELLETALKKAAELGVENEWTKEARAELMKWCSNADAPNSAKSHKQE